MVAETAVYWRGWQESKLASYQQSQGSSNHCAKFAAASAVNLLLGSSFKGDSLVSWLDSRMFRGTIRYTILGNNNGSLVFQTANLIRRLGQNNGLVLQVKSRVGILPTLLNSLKDGGAVTLVSVSYFQGKEPLIARGNMLGSIMTAARWVGGHIMILGAYDPGHHNLEGEVTPWGFLSSWTSKDQLYWMADKDFKRTWGQLSIYNMVTIRTL